MLSATGLMGVIGAVILGLALAYAMVLNRNRSRHNEKLGQAATREQYRRPDSYDPQKYRDQLVRNPDGSMPDK